MHHSVSRLSSLATSRYLLTMSSKKRKVRADFRKNREARARDKQIQPTTMRERQSTRRSGERVSGKGDISRKRTVAGAEIVEDDAGTHVLPGRGPRDIAAWVACCACRACVSIVRDESGAIFHAPRAGS